MATGWFVPGFGKPVPMRGPGAMVTIHSRDGRRRVSVRPAFDPVATSMTPVPGWTAAAAARAARTSGLILDWPDLPAMAA